MSETSGEPAATGAIRVVGAAAVFGNVGFHSADASWPKETARGSFSPFGFSPPCSKFSTISLIGVMPQIGSLENGKLYAIAPTRRPSMNTGEPDIPAKTL